MNSPFDLLSAFNQSLRDFNYNPATRWDHFFSPQIVFNSNPRDVEVESAVLKEVGSYGKQLSVILEAVSALSRQLPEPGDSKDRQALHALRELQQTAKAVAHRHNDRLERDAMEDFVKQLAHAQAEDPARYREVVRKLKQTLKRLDGEDEPR